MSDTQSPNPSPNNNNEEKLIMRDSHSLPPEILLDIIIRLPIKSIITCTSVCKTWKSLIQNPSFISNYLRLSTTKYDLPLLLFRLCSKKMVVGRGRRRRRRIWFKDEKEFYALHWDNQDFDEYTRFDDFPFHAQSRCGIFRVVGTCNGLVCLADDSERYDHNFILWNPCVRKFVQLPKPNISFPTHLIYIASFGFGFDSKTNDYKVVRIMTFREIDSFGVGESPPEVEVEVEVEAEVYSLATGEWKTLTAPTGTELYGHTHASVNGALHWVGFRRTKDNVYIKFILVLDFEDEVFREIAMPKFAKDESYRPISISAYGNSLAVFQQVSMHSVNIWLMKEYGNASSWTKIVIFVNQALIRQVIEVRGFRKSGEVILLMNDRKLVSRGLETQEIEDLGIAGSSNTFVDSYVESLVLLDKTYCAVTY